MLVVYILTKNRAKGISPIPAQSRETGPKRPILGQNRMRGKFCTGGLSFAAVLRILGQFLCGFLCLAALSKSYSAPLVTLCSDLLAQCCSDIGKQKRLLITQNLKLKISQPWHLPYMWLAYVWRAGPGRSNGVKIDELRANVVELWIVIISNFVWKRPKACHLFHNFTINLVVKFIFDMISVFTMELRV